MPTQLKNTMRVNLLSKKNQNFVLEFINFKMLRIGGAQFHDCDAQD